jgi:triosephosphate isomerase (TIM)
MPGPITVGVSLKAYFGHAQARDWLTRVAEAVRGSDAVAGGRVRLFVVPGYLQLPYAVEEFAGTPVRIGAQDVSEFGRGPFTGEVAAEELAELGVTMAEIGHAERRRLLGEDDAVVAGKTAAALAHDLTPVLCLGETERMDAAAAADAVVAQLRSALDDAPAGAVVVAYEPVWAIGATEPAPIPHILEVSAALRAELAGIPERAGSAVIYGGSAGPGLLTRLGAGVDGLFLGRFAHDVDALLAVLDEAAALHP